MPIGEVIVTVVMAFAAGVIFGAVAMSLYTERIERQRVDFRRRRGD